jgi:sugar porter (SP) family MFS transporter
MNYGFTYVTHSAISWRFPLAFQCFFALVTIAMVFIAPESPRWLIMTERVEEATTVIAALNDKPENDPEIVEEVSLLVASVNHEAHQQSALSVKEIFYKNEQMNWRRILLGAGTPFFQQFGGVNVIAYYLPVVLVRSFGMSDRLALILSAVDSMSLMFWGALASLLIDRIGRRRLMMWGVLCSGVCFCVVAIGLRYGGPGSSNDRASTVAVAFIFLYYVFYGLSMLSIPYMYPPEINSQRMRNVGTSIATAVNWISVYIVVVITPIAIDNIGWKYYLIYAVFNFAFVPIIYHWYVETANLSLEQVDRLFALKYNEKSLSWRQAEKQAREETHATIEAKIKDAEHVEVVPAKHDTSP